MNTTDAVKNISLSTVSRGLDGTEAFYMAGKPVERIYESDLMREYREGNEKCGKLLKSLQSWRVKFLKGNR